MTTTGPEPERSTRRWPLPLILLAAVVGALLWLGSMSGRDEDQAATDPQTPPASTDPQDPDAAAPTDPEPDGTTVIFGPLPRGSSAERPVPSIDQSVLHVEGEGSLVFAKAAVRIDSDSDEAAEGMTRVFVYSDDPDEASDDDFAGNTFYLPMDVAMNAADDLAGRSGDFDAAIHDVDNERVLGIFMGDDTVLRPYAIEAAFEGTPDPDEVRVVVEGTFTLARDRGQTGTGERRYVTATLEAIVKRD